MNDVTPSQVNEQEQPVQQQATRKRNLIGSIISGAVDLLLAGVNIILSVTTAVMSLINLRNMWTECRMKSAFDSMMEKAMNGDFNKKD